MKIGIVFGGKSFEHDISIITACLTYHALAENYEVYPLYITKEGELKLPKKMEPEAFVKDNRFVKISWCFHGFRKGIFNYELDVMISCMHGMNGEDGLAAVIANLYDIPFVGAKSTPAALLMDKYYTYAILKQNRIKTIPSKLYQKGENEPKLSYPLILKPARLGSSIGISVVSSKEHFLTEAQKAFQFDDRLVIQKYIENFKEYNQAAYRKGNKIIVSRIEEVFKKDSILSFEDKYLETKTKKQKQFIIDEDLIQRISETTIKIYELFELSGIVRVDYMFFEEALYVNEINTTPGSLAYYLFDKEFISLLEDQIYEALRESQRKRITIFESSVLDQNYSLKK